MEKFGFKNATYVLGIPTLPRHTGGAYNTDRIGIPQKVITMLHRRFVRVGKTLTDLQILGCELHQNAFGGRAPSGPAGGAIAPPGPIALIRGGEEKGKGWEYEWRRRGLRR